MVAPPTTHEIRTLIRRMSLANPRWGAPRIHGELLKLGINIGEIAGAGVVDHIHMHIVPRWGGDTNFMPVIADTRVMPQTLEQSYEALRGSFD